MKAASYTGRCHCGALGFEYQTAIAPADWPVRACQCSYCLPRGATYTSDPAGALRWTHADATQLRRYRFAHQTADFLFCGRCGCYLGATMTGADPERAVINIRVLQAVPAGLAAAQPVSFDGESGGDRATRHGARWTPVSAG